MRNKRRKRGIVTADLGCIVSSTIHACLFLVIALSAGRVYSPIGKCHVFALGYCSFAFPKKHFTKRENKYHSFYNEYIEKKPMIFDCRRGFACVEGFSCILVF